MSNLKVPIISVVIGEGGSGGALAIGILIDYACYRIVYILLLVLKVARQYSERFKASHAAEALCITRKTS